MNNIGEELKGDDLDLEIMKEIKTLYKNWYEKLKRKVLLKHKKMAIQVEIRRLKLDLSNVNEELKQIEV